MSDRIALAVAELVEALRAEFAAEVTAAVRRAVDEPERLLTVDEAAAVLGIGRSRLYDEIQSGRCRSVKVGRRRLIPASALRTYSEGAA